MCPHNRKPSTQKSSPGDWYQQLPPCVIAVAEFFGFPLNLVCFVYQQLLSSGTSGDVTSPGSGVIATGNDAASHDNGSTVIIDAGILLTAVEAARELEPDKGGAFDDVTFFDAFRSAGRTNQSQRHVDTGETTEAGGRTATTRGTTDGGEQSPEQAAGGNEQSCGHSRGPSCTGPQLSPTLAYQPSSQSRSAGNSDRDQRLDSEVGGNTELETTSACTVTLPPPSGAVSGAGLEAVSAKPGSSVAHSPAESAATRTKTSSTPSGGEVEPEDATSGTTHSTSPPLVASPSSTVVSGSVDATNNGHPSTSMCRDDNAAATAAACQHLASSVCQNDNASVEAVPSTSHNSDTDGAAWEESGQATEEEETREAVRRARERRRQLANRVRALRRENRRLKTRSLCDHCGVRPKDLTLLPCGHFCFCQECGASFHDCPVCRKTILADIKTFVS